jgi:uncharacterized protein (DUF983 family)
VSQIEPAHHHAHPVGRGTTLWWGFTRRCARCGAGHLFRNYLTMVPDCPNCGLHFERESGYWAGALAVNMMATGGLFAIVFVALLVATVPNIPVLPIIIVLLPIALFGPVVYYPFSKTVWVAIDRAFLQRLDPNEAFDERL